ncbi:ABC transporter A family member 7 [Glycine max]|uniref:ABC transporter A family member 7 n=1 Tax=Glycine max TaxID=3847 RepID=UPI001B355B04|nr:ABC transporter A family member 7 [Glycine max]
MENGNTANEPASFWTQANALLRKNLTFQKRNVKTNVGLILSPFILCLLLVLLQRLLEYQLDKAENKCGCVCVRRQGDTCLEEECGIEHSDLDQFATCPIPSPPEWPPLLQVPAPQYRAVRTDYFPFSDFPNTSCRKNGSCPVTMLFTGTNQSFGEIISRNMIPSTLSTIYSSDIMASLASNVVGSESEPGNTNFLEPAFFSDLPIYYLQNQCTQNSTFSVSVQMSGISKQQEVICAQGLRLWRNSSSEVNNELYKGYWRSNIERQINEIAAGYDFLNSNGSIFNVSIWYNSTYKKDTGFNPIALARIPRSVNLVSNAYLQFLLGPGTKMFFEFVKEMPKPETPIKLDLASLLGGVFFTWVILQLFPIPLTSLVYEKQQKLRIMMKMHGLDDGPYWMISYGYFLAISIVYMLCFVIFGSVIGLNFFTMNDYSIQSVFYFIYINLQISLAFLLASLFSNVKTATVLAYIGMFGTGLLADFPFHFFVQDTLYYIYIYIYIFFFFFFFFFYYFSLLWESLTGREHLLFYGRLKNLKGSALTQAVEESLKSVNLFHGGVADKQAGKYSGGMKRRLSVAISLIGDPKVVYMDEPSTGLDPASRKNLWNVVKRAKQDRAIILTTHSMEEAEVLCDRLGIFVDGGLQCIGNPKELKARYGGTYVFTMTTSIDHENDVENLVRQLFPNANKIYHISGTQKFELPKDEVKIANVFQAVETAKRSFTVSAWGLADTTLEDVFIKVARGAQAFNTLS